MGVLILPPDLWLGARRALDVYVYIYVMYIFMYIYIYVFTYVVHSPIWGTVIDVLLKSHRKLTQNSYEVCLLNKFEKGHRHLLQVLE